MSYTLKLISLLCLCTMRVPAVDTFPKKFTLGERRGSVTLNCHTATELPVIWKHGNVKRPENGTKLTLHDFDADLTGNYTCGYNDEVLHYTYILLDVSKDIPGSHITCTSETFNCSYSISCRMNISGFYDFRLRNERDNNSWVQPSKDGVFYLMHSTNPYAEEKTRLVVVGEAISSSGYYVRTSHSFYLRDIIKPGCPKFSVAKGVVDLTPPDTWASPSSYYPLENEIQCQWRSNGETNTCNLVNGKHVPEDVSKLRVRCRDPLLLSQWSEWTPWKNVSH
uniref:Ig-like domain-containing protein n=1 Tax=Electrophorus electricus TaxID=8005 RepID=A0A4W4EPX6_ELEEL